MFTAQQRKLMAQRYSTLGGGTPKKDMTTAPAVPAAPSVASRTKPGTVPRRMRGYKNGC